MHSSDLEDDYEYRGKKYKKETKAEKKRKRQIDSYEESQEKLSRSYDDMVSKTLNIISEGSVTFADGSSVKNTDKMAGKPDVANDESGKLPLKTETVHAQRKRRILPVSPRRPAAVRETTAVDYEDKAKLLGLKFIPSDVQTLAFFVDAQSVRPGSCFFIRDDYLDGVFVLKT